MERKVLFFISFENRSAASISYSLKGLIGTVPANLSGLLLLINSVVFEQICGASTAGHQQARQTVEGRMSREMGGMSRSCSNRIH